MHAGAKLVIGILIFLIGIYWYVADYIPGAVGWKGTGIVQKTALRLLVDVFFGVFGLVLIIFGLLVAWVEYEDLKWEREERKQARRTRKKRK